jgi:hypothetical protein
MRTQRRVVAVAGLLACWVVVTRAAVEYPLTMVADAQVKTEIAMVSASITIRVDRPMEASRWTRVTDALKFNGYPGFLNTLRTLPSIGTIELGTRKVLLRYSHEQPAGAGSRLVLVADRPLFFLGGDAEKSRAGYELTIVEVTFDAQGRATGRMTGAARVKPAGDGGVVLDDFAEAPVQLSFRENRP